MFEVNKTLIMAKIFLTIMKQNLKSYQVLATKEFVLLSDCISFMLLISIFEDGKVWFKH